MPQRFRKALTLFEDCREMMADEIRLGAYRRAIADVVREGDVVVHHRLMDLIPRQL
ncbi:MAG: hypothetical protein GXP55_22985 [Deltaproteobacteria bacterium]|nr:hypothetical protein [Deltaproteobacteria bacterium]